MLEIKGLSKKYGSFLALNDFNYTFDNGIYGLLGANGAGKSTLMNLITDNIRRTDGSIKYDGTDILKLGAAFRSVVGYMPQEQGLYEHFSARVFLYYMAELKGIKKREAKAQIEELLKIVNLTDSADKKTGKFSGGMKQRVLLAQALLGNPKILLLDEPTSGLDPKERVNFRHYVEKLSENKIIIVSTHVVTDVETIADKILIMKNGELVADNTPNELIAMAGGSNLEDVYMSYFQMEQDSPAFDL